MAQAIVAHDDGAYAVRMAAQADVYMEELDEEDPVFDLAVEIQDAEGGTFTAAYEKAGAMLEQLSLFGADWDAQAWLAGNEAVAVF